MAGFEAQRWRRPERLACAVAALLVTMLIGYALVMGLRAAPLLRALADDSPLALFNLKPPPPKRPDAVQPPKPRAPRHEGGGHPAPGARTRAIKADRPPPARIISPPPLIPLPQPIAPPTAPVAGGGAGTGDTADGAGAGGQGNGTGSGGSGRGTGSGEGDGGSFAHARQTDGRFRNSDFPPSVKGAGRLKIGVRYAIGPSGRVDRCDIIESSGYGEVDAMTCRIIMERYRFRPARDPDGYPVTEVREEDYRWRVH